MPTFSKIGSFSTDPTKTVGQAISITDISFEPKFVLFFWDGSVVGLTESGAFRDSYNIGFGAGVSSSNRFCVTNAARDGGNTTGFGIHISQFSTEVIRIYPSGGADSFDPEGILDFNVMSTSGFSLIVDDQFDNPYKITYLAVGGDDITNVTTGNKLIPTTSGVFYSVSGLGFQPDALILVGNRYNKDASYVAGPHFSIGFGDSNLNQGVVSLGVNYSDPPVINGPNSYSTSGEIHSTYRDVAFGTDLVPRDSLTSMNSDGFTLYHKETQVSNRYFSYLALKGGYYKVGGFNTRLDYNDMSETLGFRPAAVLFISDNKPMHQERVYTDYGTLSIGAATSTINRHSVAVSTLPAYNDTVEAGHARFEDEVYIDTTSGIARELMDMKSISNTGFITVMDLFESPSGAYVTYLAMGYYDEGRVPTKIGRATVIMI